MKEPAIDPVEVRLKCICGIITKQYYAPTHGQRFLIKEAKAQRTAEILKIIDSMNSELTNFVSDDINSEELKQRIEDLA